MRITELLDINSIDLNQQVSNKEEAINLLVDLLDQSGKLYAKAKEEGKLAIQVDANKDDQQPGYVLTSVIKNTEVPVYDIVKEAVNGKIDKMDRAQTYSLASGAASITDLSEISKHIQDSGKDNWEEFKTEIKDVEDKISDGTIVVPEAQSGEEFDASKCPNVTVI